MDVCEPEKHAAVDTPRPPLSPTERNNAVTTRRPRTREVSSRYKSPSPSTASNSRRSPSPNLTTIVPSNPRLVPKRAVSAERKRPSTPPSPQRPSTPIRDSSVDSQLSSRRMSIGDGRLPESLWPSTMQSLSFSFQSDCISIPVSKKEKSVNSASSDRTLRSSSNVGHKQAETPSRARKPTPERKRSPLKGRNSHDQSENAKPVYGLHSRLIDQQRWPSRIGGKVSSSFLNKSVDFTEKSVGNSAIPGLGIGLSSLRRTPTTDSLGNPLKKSVSDAGARLLSLHDIGRVGSQAKSIDDSSLRLSGLHKFVSPSLSDRTILATPAAKSQSLPTTRSRPVSPSRTSGVSSSVVKGVSPSRARPSDPPSRGVSPSRIRPSSSSGKAPNSTAVLSFIADLKKGKKCASYIEDAHHLRLMYNRYLQWRFANARTEAVLYVQKINVEETLYNVWNTTLTLWDSIIRKRINLQELKLGLKLNSVLNDQISYLDDWGLLEREHIKSLSGAVDDLEAITLRLPVTGGATADIESLKIASAQLLMSCRLWGLQFAHYFQGWRESTLVSELAVVAAEEKAMLDACEALLASTAAKQVEEYSLRTHLIQTKQA
ncbi:AUGMIN subunit 8-like isoform X1 [Tripterygium wilfordii]|uniref:AUGMIN subunit 8-like isoform X1 n=1 Tax=Tripterygium wilfordii TaxID=458696 RepID=UPI0018F81B6E|nr:AUGMIN subunit 8-like isoform X1 [Tripterygium wilfordii]